MKKINNTIKLTNIGKIEKTGKWKKRPNLSRRPQNRTRRFPSSDTQEQNIETESKRKRKKTRNVIKKTDTKAETITIMVREKRKD